MAHVLLVPFPVEGHINGLLGLAQALAHKGLPITFAFPARAHALLQHRRKALQLPSSVSLHVVPDGLSTDPTHLPNIAEVEAATQILRDALKLLIQTLSTGPLPISCIVSDTFAPWTQDLATEVAIPRVEYWTSTATSYSMGFHLPELIARGHLPVKENRWALEGPPVDFIPGLPPFSVAELPYEFLIESLSDDKFQFMARAFSRAREAHTILVNSLYELESSAIDALQSSGIPIYAVGLLFSPSLEVNTASSAGDESPFSPDRQCLKWLDQQRASSVVYVSLGSWASLTSEETHEMALGLEASGCPFLWVIRVDAIKGDLAENLPKGFLSRTAERGLIIKWAPQPEVLKHGSIGAFLTHCGWNSTMESLWGGKAMITCPKGAEQRSNGRQIVDKWKVGVELMRTEDGSFTKEAVAGAVKVVMQTPEFRQRALELQQVAFKSLAPGGNSDKNTTNFVNSLKPELCPVAKKSEL